MTDDKEPEKDSLLSEPMADHEAAVALGKEVAKHGIKVYDQWRGLIDTLFEWASVMAGLPVK